MSCGGLGEIKTDQNDSLKQAIQTLHPKIVSDANISAQKLNLVHYAEQIVNGTNYFCKLQLDGTTECVHARIWKGLPHTGGNFELHGVQGGHSMDSEIGHF